MISVPASSVTPEQVVLETQWPVDRAGDHTRYGFDLGTELH